MAPRSVAERKFVEDGLTQDLRLDGRARLDLRPLHIQPSMIPQASGSARVKMGGTDVIVGVKVEIGIPLASAPTSGRLVFGVDVSATASLAFQGRGGEELSVELTHALTQCFGGSATGAGAAFPPGELGIIPGRTCWVVYVDGLVLSADGAILDVLAIAAKAALADTRVPLVAVTGSNQSGEEDTLDFEVEDDPSKALQLPQQSVPVILTLRQCGKEYYVDATSSEEALMHPGMSVAVNSKGLVCGMLKTGVGGVAPSTLQQMIAHAQTLACTLHTQIDRQIQP